MLCSRLISSLASIVLFFAPVVSALDETEEAIRASVNDHLPAHLELLERVVNINSGTMNVAGVTRVGREFANAFDDLGFTTEWVDGAEFQRGGHLLASHGDRGPKILLIGHLDTVFASDSPFQRFERLELNSNPIQILHRMSKGRDKEQV